MAQRLVASANPSASGRSILVSAAQRLPLSVNVAAMSAILYHVLMTLKREHAH